MAKVYGGKTVDSVAEFEADAAAFGDTWQHLICSEHSVRI